MSIRDIVVTLIFLGAIPAALQHPSVGVLLWTWISVMNPHKLAWGFATNMPFAAIAAGVTLVALFLTRDRIVVPRDGVAIVLVAFVAFTALTTLNAIDRPDSMIQLNKVFKIQLMTLVAMAVLNERRYLQAFVWINVLSLGFYGIKGGLFTLVSGGAERVWGPPGGFIEGNNELALALVMVIPLMYYLRLVSMNRWVRTALLAAMLLSGVSALGTHSRGALLAIVAMVVVLWWRSPKRSLTFVPMLVASVAIFAFMPENWLLRMESIQNYEQDGSAMGRINAWWTMLHLANDRLLGGGFSIYSAPVFAAYSPDPNNIRAAHSIYFQVLGEHGWIGFTLFVLIWVLGWRMAARLRRDALRADGDLQSLHLLAGMCQVSLIGYAVGGAFLSLAYFDLPYNILVMLVVANRLLAAASRDQSVVARAGASEESIARTRRISDRALPGSVSINVRKHAATRGS
ncbi:MAG: putative O-glycosylation ligase, exosortase A system-associated [Burkholderiaceae bacterium]|jgi:probable O-glycosylation ligase (exosortase A-associated)|nr:putative O-glycosylation ligase, exosortase A system-associated [Burkholderiaceae bacterium]